ncbi:MAG: PIN domain-containing protein [Acidisphaera sp.]|nr:PIN domain-containing protein [Acidisphaera sp.]
MSDEGFFDTNVLVYAVARDDPRAPVAADLLARGGRISVQVLNEFASTARRRLKWPWAEVMDALAAFRVLCPAPLPIGVGTHEAALEIAARDGFAFYDALIVAAALEAGCGTLWSEDMQHGQVISGRLTVRNPFARR